MFEEIANKYARKLSHLRNMPALGNCHPDKYFKLVHMALYDFARNDLDKKGVIGRLAEIQKGIPVPRLEPGLMGDAAEDLEDLRTSISGYFKLCRKIVSRRRAALLLDNSGLEAMAMFGELLDMEEEVSDNYFFLKLFCLSYGVATHHADNQKALQIIDQMDDELDLVQKDYGDQLRLDGLIESYIDLMEESGRGLVLTDYETEHDFLTLKPEFQDEKTGISFKQWQDQQNEAIAFLRDLDYPIESKVIDTAKYLHWLADNSLKNTGENRAAFIILK